MSLLSTQQLPVGTGFSRNADRARTYHGFLHRGDARWHRGSHPRQRFSGWPQETLQKAKRVWQCIPQQVRAHSPQTRDHFLISDGVHAWKKMEDRGKVWEEATRAPVTVDTRAQHSCVIEFPSNAPAGIFSSNGFLCVSWPTGPRSHPSEKAPESFHTSLKVNAQNTGGGWGGNPGDLWWPDCIYSAGGQKWRREGASGVGPCLLF